jgi:hypothetical protein
VYVAGEHRLPAWAEELHGQDLPPGERGERVGLAHEPDAGAT